MNKKQLADIYGINYRTLKARIEHPALLVKLSVLGYEKEQRYLTPAQTEVIKSHLGTPSKRK